MLYPELQEEEYVSRVCHNEWNDQSHSFSDSLTITSFTPPRNVSFFLCKYIIFLCLYVKLSLSSSITVHSHESVKLNYVPFIKVWHNYVFIHKPCMMLEFNLGVCECGWEDWYIYFFPLSAPSTVSFWVSCCQHYCGAAPRVWLCLRTHTVCSQTLSVSGCKSVWCLLELWPGVAALGCASARPYECFLILPSVGLWFLHPQIILCRVTILLPLQINPALERKVIIHQNSKHQDKVFLFRWIRGQFSFLMSFRIALPWGTIFIPAFLLFNVPRSQIFILCQ